MKIMLKLVISIVLFWSGFSYSQSSPSMQAKSPVSIDGTIGNEFIVNIDVNNVTNFLGASFNLTYNTIYLDYVTATTGSWVGNSSDLVFLPTPDEAAGLVSVGIVRKGTVGGINGSGNIVSVKFRIISLPSQTTTLPFTLSDLTANDPNGGTLQLAIINSSSQLIIQGGYSLTVTATNGTIAKNPDQASYTNGATVILTATPNQGYLFTSWSGDASGTINPLTVIMDGNKNIAANFAIVPIIPTVIVSNKLVNFGEVLINTISTEKSYNVTGSNLTANLVISAPNGFQISQTNNIGFTSSLTLVPIVGNVNATIYVRFMPNETKNYIANITNNSVGATSQNVEVNGTGILPPLPTVNINQKSLIFGDVLVNTNSSPKEYSISGSNLSSNITITAPSNFQISLKETNDFSSSITLDPTNGTVSTTLIWVRFNPAVAQSYSGNIINYSTGATTINVTLSGTGGHKLTANCNPSNGGITSGDGIHHYGKNVAVSAKPNNGFTFTNWTENGLFVSPTPSYIFTMPNNNITLVANFSDGKNRAPFFLKTMPDTTITIHNVQVLFLYQFKASDPDGNPVNFKLDSGPEGSTMSGTGLFSWIPKTNQAGQKFLLRITITDGTLTETTVTTITTLSTIAGVENEDLLIPSKFCLEQNFPNPFNPTTQISFDIPNQSYVSLRVYDVLGKEVAILTSAQHLSGSYTYSLNAANLPSGIYFYHIIAGTFQQTKKMLLIK